jgi:hypothetical protein
VRVYSKIDVLVGVLTRGGRLIGRRHLTRGRAGLGESAVFEGFFTLFSERDR